MQSPDRWALVESLFDAAWELPETQRRRWIEAQECAAEVRAEVLRLLDAADRSDGFLATQEAADDAYEASAPMPAGERAGAWRVVRPVGRGGMGDVYEVERADGHFAQRAALKRIARTRATDASRFEIERATLARLEHPGIARLIDGGLLDDGRPFMVMEFVDGLPIDEWCDRRQSDAAARVRLVLQVCDALAHAHGKLVVHRDVKPSNILVDAQGRARLIDFGVVHLADAAERVPAAAPLSPAYAAPEQIDGAPVSTATDVYGVAAVLYRLIAGQPPREAAGLPGLLALMSARDTSPRRLAGLPHATARSGSARALRTDLDAILAKALAPDPTRRYATVEALGEDLQQALRRGVVAARRDEPRHRLRRTLWRFKWPLAAAVAVGASLILGLGLTLRYADQAARERDQARREQARLEAVQQSVFHMFRSAGEMKGGSATAADVLEGAARRIESEFAREPAQAAPVLHALGELYFLIADYEAAQPLLQRLAAADPGVVDPALIAAGRYDLAQVLYRRGDAAAAGPLLVQAQNYWAADTLRWESRLVDSRLLQAQLIRGNGDHAAAAELLQSALARRIELSGAHHRETGVFHNNLGVARFASGQPEAARASFEAAAEVWRAAGLEQSPDALNTLNNWGSLELASGNVDAAEPLLREAVALRRQLYGPSAATAALLNNYGKLLLQQARADAALPVLQDAAAMGAQFAGHGSLHHVAALAASAEAQLELGHPEAGAGDATAALDAALATLGPDHVGTALASLAMARLRLDQRRPREAAVLLDKVERIAAASGPSGARLVSQAAALRTRLPAPASPPAPGRATPSP
ncbi:serine/threonine-protein kinase [Tahibacter caeni]|uniref:serine/threonine-protein kinase n=1 Tax=Tahibacter caeni TaxID=1453545 RepID=UPI00214823E4|nr:serine/threonine-protein kinase [Tahibacter caeni]